jgi:hypothetical protein
MRITKRLRCEQCELEGWGARLGTYDVLALGDEKVWQLQPRRLPLGMAHLVQPTSDRGKGPFFMLEWSVRGQEEHSLGSATPRYRWRCPNGHERILRGDTLAERWSPRDGTETI